MAKGTILLVEDEKDIRRLYKLAFSLNDRYYVEEARDVSEAKKILGNGHNIECIITDLGMPNEDGFDLIRYLRDEKNPIYHRQGIYVASGVLDIGPVKDRLRELGLPESNLIAKPMELTYLVKKVDAYFVKLRDLDPSNRLN